MKRLVVFFDFWQTPVEELFNVRNLQNETQTLPTGGWSVNRILRLCRRQIGDISTVVQEETSRVYSQDCR